MAEGFAVVFAGAGAETCAPPDLEAPAVLRFGCDSVPILFVVAPTDRVPGPAVVEGPGTGTGLSAIEGPPRSASAELVGGCLDCFGGCFGSDLLRWMKVGGGFRGLMESDWFS